jgi:hypothetical protein
MVEMKVIRVVILLFMFLGHAEAAPPTSFTHIVIVVQENRTPDNLFYAL